VIRSKKIPILQRVNYLKKICYGKKCLHLGCTDWPYTSQRLANGSLLHIELRRVASELWGLDYDQEGLDVLAHRGVPNLRRADLEHLELLDLDQKFDVILAAEIVEHLSNPGLFLRGIRRFMRQDTRLVITTVNAYCGMRTAQYGLRGRGGVAEPVHPDHVAYFSYATLGHLLARESFKVDAFFFYDVGCEHRPHNRFYWNWINDLCVRLAPQLADGIIAECSVA
jgi:2-polyprenyl-3-methyl-5-hydroxy-6-metoxy-1,4-benzoquinol methylase